MLCLGLDNDGMAIPSACGTTCTKANPTSIGIAVPTDNTSKNPEVFPGKMVCARVEKKKADRPYPDATVLVVVARW
jgi:hypothetical protein